MPPTFGLGWRHAHYRELLERLPALDFLEVHSENFFGQGGAALAVLQQGRAHYPVSLHGVGLSLGSAVGLDDWHVAQLAHLVQVIEPVRVSDHACFARGRLGAPGSVAHASDLLPIPFCQTALDVLCANVQRVQDRLQRPFMVENLSAYLSFAALPGESTLAEPAFLATLARRTGCQLLVDVNNIYVNALNQQLAAAKAGQTRGLADSVDSAGAIAVCKRWLDAIPPEAVAELHLAGHCHVDDAHGPRVIDDHGSRVCPEVWQLYRHAQARFPHAATLVEWDTQLPALQVLLDEVALARGAGG